MNRHEAIDGIVIRVRDTGDHDRYLSLLTASKGRITLLSKGSRSLRGPQMAVSQLYTYGNFEYYRRGDFYILKGGTPIQPFYALSLDIDRLNLATYLCDVAGEVSDEGEEAEELLRLLLNSLYALSRDLYPQELIKAAFEFRTAAISGYEPDLHACARCGKAPEEDLYLDVMNGALLCSECLHRGGMTATKVRDDYGEIHEAELLSPLTPSACAALRYCLSAPIERIFAFDLTEHEDLHAFCTAAQSYLLSHLGRGFDSLNFYHSMRESSAPKKER
ncbi:MAG: DNA repair protein RecO [Clostridia bacterium]|nr:DNA repair protein RecO [Clostridia bacterium]